MKKTERKIFNATRFSVALSLYVAQNELTQRDAADLIGVSVATLNSWIAEKTTPSIEDLTRVAGWLELDPCYFLTAPRS